MRGVAPELLRSLGVSLWIWFMFMFSFPGEVSVVEQYIEK